MLTRRHLIAAGAAGALTGFVGRARADAAKLTFCSWGGALSDLEKTAMLDPFGKIRGFEVVAASPTSYAKLKAMVDAGHPEWDLVDVGGRFIWQGADYLEPLDMSLIPNAKALDARLGGAQGHFHLDRRHRRRVEHQGVPGGRGAEILEGLLGRQDLPRSPRPLQGLLLQLRSGSPGRRHAARRGLSRHRGQGETGDGQDPRVEAEREGLVDGRRAAAATPVHRRARDVVGLVGARPRHHQGERSRRDDQQRRRRLGQRLGRSQGAPNAKLAMEAINYAISPEAQARLLDFGIYGPVLGEAAAKGTPEQRKFMVTAPENIKNMLILNEEQAALYSAKYENDWNRMQLE